MKRAPDSLYRRDAAPLAFRAKVLTAVVLALAFAWPGMRVAAQARAGGNALQTLPRVAPPPQSKVNVTVDNRPLTGMETLLAKTIVPKSIRIEGVRSIPFDTVSARFKGFVGQPTTIKALIDAATSVTQLYQDKGYALSFAFVPSQDFADGVVRIVAVEGFVNGVDIQGDAGNEAKQIRAIAEHLVNQRPLKRDTFQRYIGLLGRLPGLKVAANVPPPPNTEGATRLKLDVSRRKISLSTGISFNQPGVQGLFNISENGLLALGEQLSISALAPRGPDGQTFYAVSYNQPLNSDGLSAKVDASRYRSEPQNTAGLPSSVKRSLKQDKFGIAISDPIVLTDTRSLTLTGSAYGVSNDDRYTNQNTGASLGLRSQARVVQVEVAWVDVTAKTTRRASMVVAKGANIFGASKQGYSNIAGVGITNPVDLNFVRIGSSASLTSTWPLGFTTVVAATGQYSGQSLPTSEQISFGAQRFALAYEPGEAAGDSGWATSIELNRALAFQLTYFKSLVPYISYAIARTYLSKSNAPPSRLSSLALGMRWSDNRFYSVDLSVAQPLGDAPVESHERSPRVNATFSYQLD